MKKLSILAAVAMATGLASCTAQAPKATLKTDVDSLSYAIGISQTQGLKDFLAPVSYTHLTLPTSDLV